MREFCGVAGRLSVEVLGYIFAERTLAECGTWAEAKRHRAIGFGRLSTLDEAVSRKHLYWSQVLKPGLIAAKGPWTVRSRHDLPDLVFLLFCEFHPTAPLLQKHENATMSHLGWQQKSPGLSQGYGKGIVLSGIRHVH
ncbi:MAG: hypothetical protein ACYTAO_16535 [Planctomycetota bacterium]